jgi:D-glycero-alpha-D-manno-heptose 1-phosphate guanylyltransferase
MEAIVLAGGLGRRLRSVVNDVPKPMASVAGRPFLEIVIRSLGKKGFDRVILSVGYKAERITSHFGDSFAGVDIVYQVENVPLGTGGAIQASLSHCREQYVHIINGDTYLDVDSDQLEAQWRERGRPFVVARRVDDTARYGAIQVKGERIIRFSDKGSSGPGLINAGWYLMPVKVLRDIRQNVPFSFESDFLAQAAFHGELNIHITSGMFIDIGIPEDYFRAQRLLDGLIHDG